MTSYVARRRRLLEQIDGVMVISAAPIAIRNNDVEHEYRQDSDLYYLTGCTEPDCVLVLAKGHPKHKVVLFLRPQGPERDAYHDERPGLQRAIAERAGDAAHPIAELDRLLPE